jgi:hypothetical protein
MQAHLSNPEQGERRERTLILENRVAASAASEALVTLPPRSRASANVE